MKQHLNEIERLQKLAGLVIQENADSQPNPKKVSVDYSDDNSLYSVDYIFNTPKSKYRVSFDSFDKPRVFRVVFGKDKGETSALDTDEMTGEGEALRILKTISNIVNQFYNDYKKHIDSITIEGTSPKRTKIYKLILPKFIKPDVMNHVTIS